MVDMTDHLTDAMTVEITANVYYHDQMVVLMDQMTVALTVASIPLIPSQIHTNPPNHNY